MQNIRGALSKVQSATTSLFKSPEEVEGRERNATATQFSVVKRRVTEGLLQNIGKSEASPDPEFELRRNRLNDYDRVLRETRRNMGIFLNCTRNIGLANMTIGNLVGQNTDNNPSSSSGNIMNTAESSSSSTISSFPLLRSYAENIQRFDSSTVRSMMENNFLTEVLLPLDTMITTIDSLRHTIRERDNLKLDYDARSRKLRDLKLASTTTRNVTDAQKIPKKEEKLRKTGIALTEITQRLFTEFDGLERLRYSSTNGGYIDILNKYSYYQQQYFTMGYDIAGKVPNNLPSLPLPTFLPKAPTYGGNNTSNTTGSPVPMMTGGGTGGSSSLPIATIDRNAMLNRSTSSTLQPTIEEVVKPASMTMTSSTTDTSSSFTPSTGTGGWQPLLSSSSSTKPDTFTMGQIASSLPVGSATNLPPVSMTSSTTGVPSTMPQHSTNGSSGSVRDIAARFNNNYNNNPSTNGSNGPPLPPRK